METVECPSVCDCVWPATMLWWMLNHMYHKRAVSTHYDNLNAIEALPDNWNGSDIGCKDTASGHCVGLHVVVNCCDYWILCRIGNTDKLKGGKKYVKFRASFMSPFNLKYIRVAPLCVRKCSLRELDWWKLFMQCGHWCGLMLLCRFIWSISVPLCNRFEQMLHWSDFISSWPRICRINCWALEKFFEQNSHDNLCLAVASSGGALFLWIFMCEASDSFFGNIRSHKRHGKDVDCFSRVVDSAKSMVCLIACRFKLLAEENRHRQTGHSNGLPVSSWMRMWRRRLYIFGNSFLQCKHSNDFLRQLLPTSSIGREFVVSFASIFVFLLHKISSLISSNCVSAQWSTAAGVGSSSFSVHIFWLFAVMNSRTFVSLAAHRVWNSNTAIRLTMQSIQINAENPSSTAIGLCVQCAKVSASELLLCINVVNKSFNSCFCCVHTRHNFRNGLIMKFTSFMLP